MFWFLFADGNTTVGKSLTGEFIYEIGICIIGKRAEIEKNNFFIIF
jgi:hypothetical protein